MATVLALAFSPLSKFVSAQSYVDCNVKSAALLDLSKSSTSSATSDRCMQRAYECAMSEAAKPEVALSAAKGLATVGRRR